MTTKQSQSKTVESTTASRSKITQLQRELDTLQQQQQELIAQMQVSSLRLDNTHALLNEVMDSINHGVIALDLQGRITIFNHAAATMSGINPQEAIGTYYSELGLHLSGDEEHSPLIQTLNSGTKIVDGERSLPVMNSDKNLPIRYFTGVLQNPEGSTTGVVEVFEDLSEIKLLEDRVSRGRTLAALGEMAANVAHELRNPLGGIGGYAAMLYETLEDNPDARHYVQKLIEGVDSLNRVATNLLAFTRPIEPRFYREDLRTVLKEVLDYVAIECAQSSNNIDLQTRFARKPVTMELDSELLRQAFLNLLKNAVQAVDPQNGVIKVQIQQLPAEGICRIEIRDNGHGVAPEQQDKLFNPFHTTRSRGTGLGLPIARKNIELHGGQVTFRNNRKEGATFRVDFPISQGDITR
jgi:two-component system, NtrC family, sensor histidine kinase AtoS